ncbi:MAG: BtpA/SgcQ family protein [Gemmatimonadales bacterium]
MSRFMSLFPGPKPLIGMIALPPLPGYPAFSTIDALIEAGLADLTALERGGVEGVLVENDVDQPHTLIGGPEIIAAMTRVTREVVNRARVPVGVEVLLNDWRGSLAVAAAAGARFIRLDFFVDRVRSKLGVIEPEPAAILAYREAIGADSVQIFADLQVKYSAPVDGPKPMAQSAREAAAAGADAVIVTGTETGIGPTPADLTAARAGGLPVLVGSGLSPANAAELGALADGYIVGTSLRSGRLATDRVAAERVATLRRALRAT